MQFEDAFDLTMKWEGGGELHEVAGDPGGATKWGVSQRAHPDIDLPNLDRDGAMQLYRTHYWMPLQLWGLPATTLRWDVFDYAVNAGRQKAARDLQRALNICVDARGLSVTARLAVDGRIGPNTHAVAGMVAGWYDGNGAHRLQRVYRALRARHYLTLAENGMAKFIHGWLDRVDGRFNT